MNTGKIKKLAKITCEKRKNFRYLGLTDVNQSDLKQKEALTVAYEVAKAELFNANVDLLKEYEDTNTTGLGLASVKSEGKCLSFDHPEITPWDGYSNEFNEWFRISIPWYLRVFKNQMRASWEQALLINAQKSGNNND